MASQVSGLAGGGLTGTLQGTASNIINTGSGFLDRIFPPDSRENVKNKLMKFATERPRLAAFLLSQIALSGIPLLLFFIMSLSVLIFSLLAGIIVGVVGALLFTVFCVGVALLVLLPTLFVTTFTACFLFLWGLGAYYLLKYFSKTDIPGIHTDVNGGLRKQLQLDGISGPALESKTPPSAEKAKSQPVQEKHHVNGNDHATHGHEKKEQTQHKSLPSANKTHTSTEKESSADIGGVGNVKKNVGQVTSGVGVKV